VDGHPNPQLGIHFFDAATGSLGQGLSVAAGLGAAARMDKIDRNIYCIIGDGESRVQGSFYWRLGSKYVLALLLFLAGFFKQISWWVLAVGVGVFVLGQARRGTGKLGVYERVVLVPFLKVVYDAAYLSGYLEGRLSPAARFLPDSGSPPASG